MAKAKTPSDKPQTLTRRPLERINRNPFIKARLSGDNPQHSLQNVAKPQHETEQKRII
jgi:hypothetical protein